MSRNALLASLLDELAEQPKPRPVQLCVMCGIPVKSVNGRALCGATVHLINCMAEHMKTCPACRKEMEANAKT